MSNKHERITLSISSQLGYALRRKAAELDISISALAAAYIEKSLYDESTARLNETASELLQRVEQLIDQVSPATHQPPEAQATDTDELPVGPTEMRAFMLEMLLYMKELFRKEVGVRGDIAAQVRKTFGDVRVKGL